MKFFSSLKSVLLGKTLGVAALPLKVAAVVGGVVVIGAGAVAVQQTHISNQIRAERKICLDNVYKDVNDYMTVACADEVQEGTLTKDYVDGLINNTVAIVEESLPQDMSSDAGSIDYSLIYDTIDHITSNKLYMLPLRDQNSMAIDLKQMISQDIVNSLSVIKKEEGKLLASDNIAGLDTAINTAISMYNNARETTTIASSYEVDGEAYAGSMDSPLEETEVIKREVVETGYEKAELDTSASYVPGSSEITETGYDTTGLKAGSDSEYREKHIAQLREAITVDETGEDYTPDYIREAAEKERADRSSLATTSQAGGKSGTAKTTTKTSKTSKTTATKTQAQNSSYSTAVSASSATHQHVYNKNYYTEKDATCISPGVRYRICTICAEKGMPEEIPATGHTFDAWVLEKDSTCTQVGMSTRRCIVCGHVEKSTVEVKPHQAGEWTVSKKATCTEKGEKVRKCTACGKVLEKESIDAKGHTWGEWTRISISTCTTEGREKRTCSDCGTSEVRTEAKKGHTLAAEWTIDQEPTCLMYGYKSHRCKTCNFAGDVTQIPKLEHDWGEVRTTDKEGTTDGYTHRVCSLCGTDEKVAPIEYTIKVDGNLLNKEGVITDGKYTVESPTLLIDVSTKDGYKFLGYTGTGLLKAQSTVTIPTGSTGNREYVSTWKLVEFSVQYNVDKNAITDSYGRQYGYYGSETRKTINDAIVLPGVDEPYTSDEIRNKRVCIGWVDNQDLATELTTEAYKVGNTQEVTDWLDHGTGVYSALINKEYGVKGAVGNTVHINSKGETTCNLYCVWGRSANYTE